MSARKMTRTEARQRLAHEEYMARTMYNIGDIPPNYTRTKHGLFIFRTLYVVKNLHFLVHWRYWLSVDVGIPEDSIVIITPNGVCLAGPEMHPDHFWLKDMGLPLSYAREPLAA